MVIEAPVILAVGAFDEAVDRNGYSEDDHSHDTIRWM